MYKWIKKKRDDSYASHPSIPRGSDSPPDPVLDIEHDQVWRFYGIPQHDRLHYTLVFYFEATRAILRCWPFHVRVCVSVYIAGKYFDACTNLSTK